MKQGWAGRGQSAGFNNMQEYREIGWGKYGDAELRDVNEIKVINKYHYSLKSKSQITRTFTNLKVVKSFMFILILLRIISLGGLYGGGGNFSTLRNASKYNHLCQENWKIKKLLLVILHIVFNI